MADADSKRCTSCGEVKAVTEFHKKSATKDGLRGHCKVCHCARSIARYEKDPEKVLAVNAAWRAANPEKNKALHRSWYEKNKDKVLAASQAWRLENLDRHREAARIGARVRYAKDPTKARKNSKLHRERHLEKVLARERRYARENPDKVRAASAAWRRANPEKAKAADAAWNKANPDKRRAMNANRRARKRGAPGSYTAAQIEALHVMQKGCCAICRKKLKKVFHRDHITPLILGGSNDITNIQLLCPTCNCRKGPKHPIDHAQELGRLL